MKSWRIFYSEYVQTQNRMSTNIFSSLLYCSSKYYCWSAYDHPWRSFCYSAIASAWQQLFLNKNCKTVKTWNISLCQHLSEEKEQWPCNISRSSNERKLITGIHIGRPDWTDARGYLLTKMEIESNFSLEKLQLYFNHTTQVIARWPVLTVDRR